MHISNNCARVSQVDNYKLNVNDFIVGPTCKPQNMSVTLGGFININLFRGINAVASRGSAAEGDTGNGGS